MNHFHVPGTPAPQAGNKKVTLRIYGEPKPQGSLKHVGRGIMVPANKDMNKWRDHVEETLRNSWTRDVLDQAISVSAAFYLTKPKRPRFIQPATAYDADKLARAVGDAMEKSGVIKNDARICQWQIEKHYANHENPPGVWLQIAWDE